ncbi:26909_t:CDS:1, partial [Racocetra persica]
KKKEISVTRKVLISSQTPITYRNYKDDKLIKLAINQFLMWIL